MTSKQEPSTLYPVMGTVPYAPPQYNTATAPPQMQQPQQVYMAQQPTTNAPILGPHASRVTCPSCHATNQSRVRYENSSKTHLIATILFVTTCCLCCIPYCIDSCKNANHHCSSCGAYLGTYAN